MKILMVCLGNICRSPLAEGILESKTSSYDVFVDSAGTSGYHEGALPDSRSISIAKDFGIDITKQRSRKFTKLDFESFDVIYAMDESNYTNIINLASTSTDKEKVKLILSELENPSVINVPDPYYGGDDGFKNVYEMLEEACSIIISKLSK